MKYLLGYLNSIDIKAKIELIGEGVSYKVYSALLSQTGTDAPTAVVLQNTLSGTPAFNYGGVGSYGIDLTGEFPEDFTMIFISNGNMGETANNPLFTLAYRGSTDEIVVLTTTPGGTLADDNLKRTPIEIRVYPAS